MFSKSVSPIGERPERVCSVLSLRCPANPRLEAALKFSPTIKIDHKALFSKHWFDLIPESKNQGTDSFSDLSDDDIPSINQRIYCHRKFSLQFHCLVSGRAFLTSLIPDTRIRDCALQRDAPAGHTNTLLSNPRGKTELVKEEPGELEKSLSSLFKQSEPPTFTELFSSA